MGKYGDSVDSSELIGLVYFGAFTDHYEQGNHINLTQEVAMF